MQMTCKCSKLFWLCNTCCRYKMMAHSGFKSRLRTDEFVLTKSILRYFIWNLFDVFVANLYLWRQYLCIYVLYLTGMCRNNVDYAIYEFQAIERSAIIHNEITFIPPIPLKKATKKHLQPTYELIFIKVPTLPRSLWNSVWFEIETFAPTLAANSN